MTRAWSPVRWSILLIAPLWLGNKGCELTTHEDGGVVFPDRDAGHTPVVPEPADSSVKPQPVGDSGVSASDAGSAVGVCGTRGGIQCGKDEYCQFDETCGATDRGGVCATKPQICTAIYAPVCGCDGKTYGSACTAAGQGVSVAQEGECKSGEPVACDKCPGPAPGAPNYLCPDGVHTGGPACVQDAQGVCGWQFLGCPEPQPATDCHSGKAPGAGQCWSSDQCATGESCIGASCCPVGAQCLVADRPGTCQAPNTSNCQPAKAPAPGQCWTDANCNGGKTCLGAQCCPPNAQCFAADRPGTCG